MGLLVMSRHEKHFNSCLTLARKKRTALHERDVQCWSTARSNSSRRARQLCASVQRSKLCFPSVFSAPAYLLSSAPLCTFKHVLIILVNVAWPPLELFFLFSFNMT